MSKKSQKLLIILLCVACFGAGVSVSVILNKTTAADGKEKEKFNTIYSILNSDWYYSNKIKNLDSKLMEQAIDGMTTLDKDAHTNYFDLEQAKAFSSSLEGSNVGLGISFYLNEKNHFVVSNVYVNSTADKKGLKPNDEIVSLDDLECSKNDSDTIIKYIKAHEGKSVKIKYLREGKEYTTNLIPGVFDTTVICNIYDGYGEIILSSFSENSGKDFSKAMTRLQESGIKKLVLDLRNNGGGYLNAALEISSSLIPEKSVVFKEQDKSGKFTKQMTKDEFNQVKMDKIVVLQNENTASASEVLIGALKDNLGKKVTTVGTTSYGKGTEQVTVPFSDGTSFKYTVAQWYTPNGTSINKKGFKPDIEVELPEAKTTSYYKFNKKDVIKKDSVDTNAKPLQIYLKYLGYSVDRTDSYFSNTSSEGLANFQQENGLDATGDCNKKTWDLLVEKVLLKMNETPSDDTQRQSAIEEVEK